MYFCSTLRNIQSEISILINDQMIFFFKRIHFSAYYDPALPVFEKYEMLKISNIDIGLKKTRLQLI